MTSTLFLQSDVQDPFAIYAVMLQQQPLYYDDSNKIWGVYAYRYCKEILSGSGSCIPPVRIHKDLNEYCHAVINRLVRISNPPQHTICRQAMMQLFQNRQPVSIPALLDELIPPVNKPMEMDWINAVCKQLPVLSVAGSFDFTKEDETIIIKHIGQLAALMRPVKSSAQAMAVNESVKTIYLLTEKHIKKTGWWLMPGNGKTGEEAITKDERLSVYVSNLIGLFIQSYDATMGLLSNALLQMLCRHSCTKTTGKQVIQQLVTETLRFDPPVHNTQRIAMKDIPVGRQIIRKGEYILVALAAANRDPQQFKNPSVFDIERFNNNEHLTFGTGMHQCPASNTSVSMTTETLQYLAHRFNKIELRERNITYEPLVNVRLPKQLHITLY